METSFCISFSGITVRFVVPQDTQLADDLTSLRCSCDNVTADAEFHIRLIDSPLVIEGEPVGSSGGMNEYIVKEGRLRVYSPLRADDGCQVACLLRPDGCNTLYEPASRWEHESRPLHGLHLIAPEFLLIRKQAFLLHSSVVECGGRAVLFSGPACIGKSTQAALWQKHLGAQVINGDRCIIMKKDGTFFGGGSPWCGTSGIRRPEQFPIQGIVLLAKGPENRITRSGASAFVPLFSQTVVNNWNMEFMQTVTQLFTDLFRQVPVYRLSCRPEEEAVHLTYQSLFGKE